MNHGAMLWGAAMYNNGALPYKNYRFGQAYGADGAPLRLVNYTPVSEADTKYRANSALPSARPPLQPRVTLETFSVFSRKVARNSYSSVCPHCRNHQAAAPPAGFQSALGALQPD